MDEISTPVVIPIYYAGGVDEDESEPAPAININWNNSAQDTFEVPLIRLAYGRSGDKGDISNIGLIARRPEYLPLLRAEVTAERVADWLGHLVKGPVTRYDLPGFDALNFVCEAALDGGGMASLRNDSLGKGMAQILLTMPVPMPKAFLA